MQSFIGNALKYLRPVMLASAIVLLALMLARLGVHSTIEVVRSLSPLWIVATLLTIILNFLFAARRYQILVAGSLPFLKVFETIMVSFLLNYASMIQGLGIGAKVGMLKADGVQASRSIAGILSEIAFDLVFALAMGVVFYLVEDNPQNLLNGMPPLTATFVILLVVAAVVGIATLRFSQFLRNVIAELKVITRSGRLIEVLLTTTGIWLAAGLGFYCMLKASSGGSSASLFLCMFAITTGFVTGLVSMVPGGVGVREITWAYIVSLSGVPLAVASLIAVLYRVLSIVAIVLVLVLWRFVASLPVMKKL